MKIEYISFMISIFGTVTAAISMYFSRFRVGKLRVLPPRLLILQPRNFVGANGGRGFHVVTSLTFQNDGAVNRAIHDLRIRVQAFGKELILDWRDEYDTISLAGDIGTGNFPSQPTLGPDSSITRNYGFLSKLEDSDTVKRIDEPEEEQAYNAFLECRMGNGRWKSLHNFRIHYHGRRKWEMDPAKINGKY